MDDGIAWRILNFIMEKMFPWLALLFFVALLGGGVAFLVALYTAPDVKRVALLESEWTCTAVQKEKVRVGNAKIGYSWEYRDVCDQWTRK